MSEEIEKEVVEAVEAAATEKPAGRRESPLRSYQCWLDSEDQSAASEVWSIDPQLAAQKYAADRMYYDSRDRIGDEGDFLIHVLSPDGTQETWSISAEVEVTINSVRKLTAEEAAKLPGVGG